MFLQVSVCPQGERAWHGACMARGCTWQRGMHGRRCAWPGGGGWEEGGSIRDKEVVRGAGETPLQRTVRILLE